MMKMNKAINIFLLVALSAMVSCVPSSSDEKKASCKDGETFNARTRSCSAAAAGPAKKTPVGTLTTHSAQEDSAGDYVVLGYRDIDNDQATSCQASSANSGLVRGVVFDGLNITSANAITDAQNTLFQINHTGSLSIGTATIGATRILYLNINQGVTTGLDAAAALNAHGVASTWITAAVTTNKFLTPTTTSSPLTDLPCSCTGGICRVFVKPATNFNGTTTFTYSLTDNDGTGDAVNASVMVSGVGDAPNLSVLQGFSVTERLDSDTTSVLSGNLITNSYVLANDSSDGDMTGATLTFEVVTSPTQGVLSLDTAGNFSYYTYSEATSDSFTFRVRDPSGAYSSTETINIIITGVNDPPRGTLATLATFNEDSDANGGIPITLSYLDVDGDLATSCSITSVNNVYPTTNCTCLAGVCTVSMKGAGNQNGPSSFGYKVFDVHGNPPAEQTVSFTITAIDDAPAIPITEMTTGILQFTESATQTANNYTFTLDSSVELDGGSIVSYTLDTPPANGTLTGCLGSSGASTSSLNCTYTPADGSSSDAAVLSSTLPSTHLARATTDTGTFYARNFGDTYNGLTINMVAVSGISSLFSANAKAWYNTGSFTVLFESGVTTGADIITALGSDPVVSKMLQFRDTGGVQTTAGLLTLAGGAATADKFTMRVIDSGGTSTTQTLHISIIPSLDPPTLCEYSSYAQTQVCGINGCIGNTAPVNITPDADGLVFYNTNSGTCYVSSGGGWAATSNYIANRTVNELDTISIDKIKIDEGGGTSEDSETVTITNVDSSDITLVPLGSIKFYFDAAGDGFTAGDEITTGAAFAAGFSADSRDFKIEVTPQAISGSDTTRTSNIEITLQDSSGKSVEITFSVTAKKVSVNHGGWLAFKAVGPNVNSLGVVEDTTNHCPYSLDMCESGRSCLGSGSPVGNNAADPDHVDAIYFDTATSGLCYRMKRTQVQDIAYVGKTATVPTIQYVNTGAVSVTVSGSLITVNIDDGVTTTDQIISAIEGSSSAHALVKAINTKTGETQNTQGLTTLSSLSNSNWESFTTYCAISPAGLESGCSAGSLSDKKSCIGKGSPSTVITPAHKDSRYFDEENNICYRSNGTTNTSWESYSSVASVTLKWNAFTLSAAGTISEYRVFRRLAGEEFDFSQQLNRETISATGDSFTFVDDASNSRFPPVPGTVYYYVVRPVVDDILGTTSAEKGTGQFGIVRLMAPPQNMAFAHRWMINKQFCDLMGATVDTGKNHRCAYKGPGDMVDGGVYYYDFGKDLLIDRYEAGCPFSPAPNCVGTSDNSCIGTDVPGATGANLSATSAGIVYYNRSTAKCYVSTATGVNWAEFDAARLTTHFNTRDQVGTMNNKSYNKSGLPPLTHVTQVEANTACTSLNNIPASEMLGVQNPLSHVLPSRKEQLAYSLWDATMLNSDINTLEVGLSLNTTSSCNSTNASGLSGSYNDLDKPDSNNYFTLPGTASSSIRSLSTGSAKTAACASAYGVQDVVGNVSEWTRDRMNCTSITNCSAPTTIAGAPQTDYSSVDGADAFSYWRIDGTRHPCIDLSNTDGVCDYYFDRRPIKDEFAGAGLIATPMGLPVEVNAPSNLVTDYTFHQLGNGITHDNFHNDAIAFNTHYIMAENNLCGAFTGGGNYEGSGTASGSWNLEAYPCDDTSYGLATFGDITLYVDQDNTYANRQVQIGNFGGTGALSTAVSEAGTLIRIDLDVFTVNTTSPTSANIVTQLNNYFTTNQMTAVVSGSGTAVQTAFVTPLDVGFYDAATPKRASIGFRCSLDVIDGDYEE